MVADNDTRSRENHIRAPDVVPTPLTGPLHPGRIPAVNAPPAVSAQDIRFLRHRLGLSPASFAELLNVSPSTVGHWEQGARQPSRAALRLLQVIDEEPQIVGRVAGLPEAVIKAIGDRRQGLTARMELYVDG